MRRIATLLILLSSGFQLQAAQIPFRTAEALYAYLDSGATNRHPFELTGTVTSTSRRGTNRFYITLQDKTGCVPMHCAPSPELVPGDGITVQGEGCTEFHEPWATARKVTVLGKSPLPAPIELTLGKLDERLHNMRRISVSGTIIDAFPDDVDDATHFLLIKELDTILPVSVIAQDLPKLGTIINAEVKLTGTYEKSIIGRRKFSGPFIRLTDAKDIVITKPAPPDPFEAPPLTIRFYSSPREIASCGLRTVVGEVIAVWEKSFVLLRTADDLFITASLVRNVAPPVCGSSVKIVGYPETDLFNVTLTRAKYRALEPLGLANENPEQIVLRDVHQPNDEFDTLRPGYHGKLVKLVTTITGLPAAGDANRRVIVSDGTFSLPVDLGLHPEIGELLQVGSVVELTGRCLLEASRWQPNNVFPRPTGMFLVLRSPADVRIISLPPWLNAKRLMVLVGILITILIGIGIWNFVLNRLVERRSRELLREQTARADASLKIDERTRLAVELHDSLSQTLTGVSFQIDAAQEARQQDPSLIGECLDAAQRTLASCREELKNCLWDLRNNALEEPDLNKAIRMTLNPHILGTEIAIDCSIPRSRLLDSTFHNILAIIRELTVNAIRHGKAKHVTVHGQLVSRTLTFSVTDDGRGFDPDNRPGMEEGHFGLLGVCERLDKLGGRMDISSAIGKGTTVSIIIESEHEEDTRTDR